MPLTNSLSQPVFLAILGLGSANQPAPDSVSSLQIEGKAAPTAAPAVFYAFTPSVTQNGSRPLQFSIENKPPWAKFGRRHGTIYGVPQVAHAGTYSNIVITVSDGINTVRLPPFSIVVSGPTVAAATPTADPNSKVAAN